MPAKNLSASGFLYDERRTFNLDRDDSIHYLYKEVTPFLGWLTDKPSEEVDDPDFKMLEDQGGWRHQRMVLNMATPPTWTNGQPGDTVDVDIDGTEGLSVDASLLGVQFMVWDSTKATYKGNVIVDAIVDSDTVTIKSVGNPQVADQAIPALADDDIFEISSHDWGEGKEAPEARNDELRKVYNSCSITRTSIEVTGTLYKTSLRATRNGEFSNELDRLRKNRMKEHKLRLEKKYLTSWRVGGIGGTAHNAGGGTDSTFVSHNSDADGDTVRTTAGFIPTMLRYGRTSGDQQNVFDISQSTGTFTDLLETGDKISQYSGSLVKKAFLGPSAMTYLQSLANAETSGWQINIEPSDTDEYGAYIRRINLGNVTYELTPLQSLRGTGFDNYMLIPHEDHVYRKYFRPDSLETNIKTDNNYDGIKDEYFSDDGLGLTQIDSSAIIRFTS